MISLYVNRNCAPLLCPNCKGDVRAFATFADSASAVRERLVAAASDGEVEFRGCDFLDHPEARRLVEIALGFGLKTSFVTNGVRLGDHLDLALRVERVTVQIDAVTPLVYNQIWHCSASRLWQVIAHVRMLRDARGNRQTPEIVGGFRTFFHNEHEKSQVERYYKQIGVDRAVIV